MWFDLQRTEVWENLSCGSFSISDQFIPFYPRVQICRTNYSVIQKQIVQKFVPPTNLHSYFQGSLYRTAVLPNCLSILDISLLSDNHNHSSFVEPKSRGSKSANRHQQGLCKSALIWQPLKVLMVRTKSSTTTQRICRNICSPGRLYCFEEENCCQNEQKSIHHSLWPTHS